MRSPVIKKEGIIVFVIWLFFLILTIASDQNEFLTACTFSVFCGWVLYQLSVRYLFTRAATRKYPFLYYLGWMLLGCFVAFWFTTLLSGIIWYNRDEDFMFGTGGIAMFMLLFLFVPAQWFIFQRLARSTQEVFVLKKELGKTEASADFLRTQINPHFLFNALNTLYGLAIQEKAERTGEAVEKLGSMMRFMLQENIQEKIPLVRELEYLNNYIALQRLRTDVNPGIRIQVNILDPMIPSLQIAPMLLIPFVENAFKHGISFREESQITISLEVKDGVLYFDVYNKRHAKSDNDPEKHSNGIGLANVRSRLLLTYPQKHELVIRETPSDYFVHLIIKLGS